MSRRSRLVEGNCAFVGHYSFLVLLICHVFSGTAVSKTIGFPSARKCKISGISPYQGEAVSPTPPSLPQQYHMTAEVTMPPKGHSYLVDEHHDVPKLRAAAFMTYDGSTSKIIFNPLYSERYNIDPYKVCTVEPTAGMRSIFIHFAHIEKLHYNYIRLSQLFSLISRYGTMVYQGKQKVRGGIDSHFWTVCMEWEEHSARMEFQMYFSDTNYKSAWGKGQVPLQIVVNGNSGNLPGLDIKQQISMTYNILSFREGEHLDETVFHIPNDVVCPKRADDKPLPNLAVMSQMDIEDSSPFLGNSGSMQQKLRYDAGDQLLEIQRRFVIPQGVPGENWRRKLARMGRSTHNLKPMVDESDLIVIKRKKTIEDHRTGLQYLLDMGLSTCHTDTLQPLSMSHAVALQRMTNANNNIGDAEFHYQGQSLFRNMEVESWGMEYNGIVQKVFFLIPAKGVMVPMETDGMSKLERKHMINGFRKISLGSFTKYPYLVGIVVRNRTAMETRDMLTLVKKFNASKVMTLNERGVWVHTTNRNGKDWGKMVKDHYQSFSRRLEMQNEYIGELDTSMFNFQPLITDADTFDVSHCYNPDQISTAYVSVKESFSTYVKQDRTIFEIAFRKGLAAAMGTSSLQISSVTTMPYREIKPEERKIETYDDIIIIAFKLLGSPPIAETRDKQFDIQHLKEQFKLVLKQGVSFSVRYAYETKTFNIEKYPWGENMTTGEYFGSQRPSDSLNELEVPIVWGCPPDNTTSTTPSTNPTFSTIPATHPSTYATAPDPYTTTPTPITTTPPDATTPTIQTEPPTTTCVSHQFEQPVNDLNLFYTSWG